MGKKKTRGGADEEKLKSGGLVVTMIKVRGEKREGKARLWRRFDDPALGETEGRVG